MAVGGLVFAFLGVVTVLGFQFAAFVWSQETPVLNIPLGIPSLAIPVGALLFALHLLLIFRRYTDKEVVAATVAIEASSKQLSSALESALKKDKATPEAARKAMVADVKQVGIAAKSLGSAVKDRKPVSAQVKTLLDQAKKVRDMLAGTAAEKAVEGQWARVNQPLGTIAATFGQQ